VQVEVTTWSLELTSPDQVVPAPRPDLDLALVQARVPSPELSRFLYTAVGGDWYWIDRLVWSYEQWLEWQRRPGVETWVAYLEGTPAGYFELDASVAGDVELAYFGLLRGFIGRGLGGWLLTQALQRAWALGPDRVWVHTCSLDGSHALANYQARGMKIFKEVKAGQELDADPPGPWTGATGKVHA